MTTVTAVFPWPQHRKAVLVLLSDCTPRDPAALVLLNGPCIGHTAEGAMGFLPWDFMGCECHGNSMAPFGLDTMIFHVNFMECE